MRGGQSVNNDMRYHVMFAPALQHLSSLGFAQASIDEQTRGEGTWLMPIIFYATYVLTVTLGPLS